MRRRGRGPYSHADVWALTLMLAIPRRALRHADIITSVAVWVRKQRVELARHAERRAA